MNILAIDIGGTNIKMMVVDENLTSSYEEIVLNRIKEIRGEKMLDVVVDKIHEIELKYDFGVIGISSAGVIDTRIGEVLGGDYNMPGYLGLNPKEIIEGKTGYKVAIENDVNCFAEAEIVKGYLVSANSGVVVTIGTGIGGGIVIDGKVYGGHQFSAGEVGNIIVSGKRFEDVASTRALVEKMMMVSVDYNDGKKIMENHFEKEVCEVLDWWYDQLAQGLANIISVLNPEFLVLNGGIVDSDNFDVSKILERMKKYLPNEIVDGSMIVKSNLKNQAGCFGAATIAKRMMESNE